MAPDALVSTREDELAIRDLAFRYARMVDRRDWAEIPRVFTPDCELSGEGYRMCGHAELDAGLRRIDMFSATQHCVMNQVTRLDGDRASGEFYCVANHIHERDGVACKLDMGIRYEDRYLRTADGWRLAKRVLNLIWQQDLPLDLSLIAPAAAAAASGRRAVAGRRTAARRPAKGRSAGTKSAARSGSPRKQSSRKEAGAQKSGTKKSASKKSASKRSSGRRSGRR